MFKYHIVYHIVYNVIEGTGKSSLWQIVSRENSDPYNLLFWPIHFPKWTNIFPNLQKYIFQSGQIQSATWTGRSSLRQVARREQPERRCVRSFQVRADSQHRDSQRWRRSKTSATSVSLHLSGRKIWRGILFSFIVHNHSWEQAISENKRISAKQPVATIWEDNNQMWKLNLKTNK